MALDYPKGGVEETGRTLNISAATFLVRTLMVLAGDQGPALTWPGECSRVTLTRLCMY